MLELSKISEYKNTSVNELRHIALEEIVAEACQKMLTSSNAVEKLAELKSKDKSLYEKVKEFINGFFEKIRKRYRHIKPQGAEAQFVERINTMEERMAKLFEDALVDATETHRAAETQKNTADNSGVKMQLQIKNSDKFSKQIKKDDFNTVQKTFSYN